MATYKYYAMDIHSKRVRGSREAENEAALRASLSNDALYLISCKEVVDAYKHRQLKATDIADLCRQMGTMLNSGISLISAVSIVVRREPNKKLKKIYRQIYISLQQGYQMSGDGYDIP